MAEGVKTWISIDSRRVLSSADEELVGQVAAMHQDLDRLHRVMPATLHLLRDSMSGQPGSGGGGRPPWCWVHEREVRQCVEAGEFCRGEAIAGPSDVVGESAIRRDHAAEHRRALVRRVESARRELAEVVAIMAMYPAAPLRDDEEDPTPGEDLCRSCWKDNQYPQLIQTRPSNGKPYYRGLCRWCGQMRKAIGGDFFDPSDPIGDPPTWLVATKIRGDVITDTMVQKATSAMGKKVSAAKKKSTASASSKRRRRK